MPTRNTPHPKIAEGDLYALISAHAPETTKGWYIGAEVLIRNEMYCLLMSECDIYHDSRLVPALEARRLNCRKLYGIKNFRSRRLRGFVRAQRQKNYIKKRSHSTRENVLPPRLRLRRACKENPPRYAFDRRKPNQWRDNIRGREHSNQSASTLLSIESPENGAWGIQMEGSADESLNAINLQVSPNCDGNRCSRNSSEPGRGSIRSRSDVATMTTVDLKSSPSAAKDPVLTESVRRAGHLRDTRDATDPAAECEKIRQGESQNSRCESYMVAQRLGDQDVPREKAINVSIRNDTDRLPLEPNPHSDDSRRAHNAGGDGMSVMIALAESSGKHRPSVLDSCRDDFQNPENRKTSIPRLDCSHAQHEAVLGDISLGVIGAKGTDEEHDDASENSSLDVEESKAARVFKHQRSRESFAIGIYLDNGQESGELYVDPSKAIATLSKDSGDQKEDVELPACSQNATGLLPNDDQARSRIEEQSSSALFEDDWDFDGSEKDFDGHDLLPGNS